MRLPCHPEAAQTGIATMGGAPTSQLLNRYREAESVFCGLGVMLFMWLKLRL